ncbi:phage tail protein, partial [Butyricicoccus sp. 1XD8-22]
MLESTAFTFNYISSMDMGVFMIQDGNGLYNEPFLPQRSILETKVYGRKSPYFKGVDEEPLSFTLSFYIEGWKDRNNLRQI